MPPYAGEGVNMAMLDALELCEALCKSVYENDLRALVEKGVTVAQCNNTLKERKIDPNQLYDFIAIVPSGVGEIIIRQGEDWAVIKP